MLLVIQKSFIFNFKGNNSHLLVRRNDTRFISKMTKKKGVPESSGSQLQQQTNFPLRVSNTILARSVVAVFGLGFIDAGYSGDWSRIGVISKEVEDLLKIAAIVVVPLCIFLIFSFSKEPAET
ncbi:uncharacterized protein LOC111300271 [Durio zibethinus]|uniref:Uncharacterized protein LOC111300271 n=1 Tax=Durio zibethinus TaxID=66656 RepID=A0A6P5ZGL2_DURZI|nr:uncharacterized protein LOC111300271 [Durio zibethinus]